MFMVLLVSFLHWYKFLFFALAAWTAPCVGQFLEWSAGRDVLLGIRELLGRCPLAADGRHDSALLLQLGKSLINFLAVNACDFRNLASVHGCTVLTHSL